MKPGLLFLLTCLTVTNGATFSGTVVDADSGRPIPSRVYVQSGEGEWLYVKPASPEGSTLAYSEEWVPLAGSVERHTTVSAHPFEIELEPGSYTFTIERGKEYLSQSRRVVVGDEALSLSFPLKRWVNLARRGWYSGETHVHRRTEELPNVMLAEDLNVAFPVTYWTVDAFTAPGLTPSPLRRQGPSPFGNRKDLGHAMVEVDSTHVFFPRNTEYEVFSVGDKRHVLGAVFLLNHKSVFEGGMPPVAKIAEQAHREGALLDLDKHSWPWSMMLVPIAKVDLFELSNNSIWRTEFGFRGSSAMPAPYMNVEKDERGMTEWGWLNFGFETYYTLLNCGFRLQPTAGTASGVHPVPLGYSRVYVHTGRKFDGERWIEGLRQGRSFVTTGPMLFTTLNNQHPGQVFDQEGSREYRLEVESISEQPIDRIEVVVNGRLFKTVRPGPAAPLTRRVDGGWGMNVEMSLMIEESSWVAVRTVQVGDDGRVRFAHGSPWHIDVAGKPLWPRREETDFLVGQLRAEIKRNQGVLPEAAMAEFKEALRIYEGIAARREAHERNSN